MSATTFVGYCVGNTIGPAIFGASPGPIFHAGFVGSTVCLALVVVIAAGTYIGLRMENSRRNKLYGQVEGGLEEHRAAEDLSDKKNEEFGYLL